MADQEAKTSNPKGWIWGLPAWVGYFICFIFSRPLFPVTIAIVLITIVFPEQLHIVPFFETLPNHITDWVSFDFWLLPGAYFGPYSWRVAIGLGILSIIAVWFWGEWLATKMQNDHWRKLLGLLFFCVAWVLSTVRPVGMRPECKGNDPGTSHPANVSGSGAYDLSVVHACMSTFLTLSAIVIAGMFVLIRRSFGNDSLVSFNIFSIIILISAIQICLVGFFGWRFGRNLRRIFREARWNFVEDDLNHINVIREFVVYLIEFISMAFLYMILHKTGLVALIYEGVNDNISEHKFLVMISVFAVLGLVAINIPILFSVLFGMEIVGRMLINLGHVDPALSFSAVLLTCCAWFVVPKWYIVRNHIQSVWGENIGIEKDKFKTNGHLRKPWRLAEFCESLGSSDQGVSRWLSNLAFGILRIGWRNCRRMAIRWKS